MRGRVGKTAPGLGVCSAPQDAPSYRNGDEGGRGTRTAVGRYVPLNI